VPYLGIDIGGANLKAADADGNAHAEAFAVWKQPDRLAERLGEILTTFPATTALAVTMTAELADCFETKAEGVDRILAAVEQAAQSLPVFVWQTGAEFVTPDVARDIPLLVAAANWHALATWVGRVVPKGAALLIDVGSTTADLIPLRDGIPVPTGLTDVERLKSGELVYTGVRRTPLCAIAASVPFGDGQCPLAAEFFATTLDVYITLGHINEDVADFDTANGRAATKPAAHDRLARCLCCDRNEFSLDDAMAVCRFLADAQRQTVTEALSRVTSVLNEPYDNVLVSGSGAFLAEDVLDRHPLLKNVRRTSLRELFGDRMSEAACAMAVARLATERLSAQTTPPIQKH